MADPTTELQAVYDELPGIACKGLCADSCTVIDASDLERRRLAEVGVGVPTATERRWMLELRATGGPPLRCDGLSPINTCRVYDRRPLICRLFGVTQGLQCEHGCTPERTLTDAEAFALMQRVQAISDRAAAR